ncbi:ABC transporter ATP-binding protein [Rhodosalinus sp.]|uniref:ABC transporter ATP-binding protein n=1 Tax=Rhodosalinus sp. TaxID=2047741 RepID=UPI0039792629
MKHYTPNAQSAITAEGITKTFDGKAVLDGISIDLAPGEVIALLGPSGCGKTTLLRIAAGLLAPCAGRLHVNGRLVADGANHVAPPEARGLGMVFQDYALWPHLSVVDNVAFPLRMRGMNRADRRARALRALARVGLDHMADRAPGTLSGGQQQRVALARAVVAEPPLVLFDEPLSNLDRELRESLAIEIGALLRDLGLSALYVTHDQAEAFTIADRVAVMHDGRIVQLDKPEGLYSNPATLAVARFLNTGAILEGTVADGRFRGAKGSLDVTAPQAAPGAAHLLVPRAALAPALPEHGALTATVEHCRFQGDRYLLSLALEGEATRLTCTAARPARAGAMIGLDLDHDRLRVFPATA